MSNLRIFEIILYSCLNLIPYLGLAIYPFIDKLRFSKKTTMFFAIILTIFQNAMGIYATTCSQSQKGLISLISTVSYAAFYFIAIKDYFGIVLSVSHFQPPIVTVFPPEGLSTICFGTPLKVMLSFNIFSFVNSSWSVTAGVTVYSPL